MTEAVMERPPQVQAVAEEDQDVLIPCSMIDADFNYRRRYDRANMESLRAAIRAAGGLLNAVHVRPRANGRYQLLIGNRRFRAVTEEYGPEAAIKAKIRRDLDDAKAVTIMMMENGERVDPSAIEDAEGAARMLGLCNGDRNEAAARLGWERKKLDRRLALMNAIPQVRDAYLDNKIELGHTEIFAALRKEVQERVLTVMLTGLEKGGKIPTVEALKKMADQSLLELSKAIFDKTECAGCDFNTGNQQALFDTSFEGTRCTNRECFTKKTDAELETRRAALVETYQVVRIVRQGENATMIPLRAEGKQPVGEAQASECRTCGDFGACVSAVPDTLGNVYKDVCFNQTCHTDKVAAYRKTLEVSAPPAPGAAAGQGSTEASPAGAAPSQGSEKPQQSDAASRRGTTTNSVRPQIKEYREQVWRLVFQRAAQKLPVLQSRALLVAMLTHRPGDVRGGEAMGAVNKALDTAVPISGTRTSKLLRSLLAFDQNKLAVAFQQLPAHLSETTPIDDVVGYLNALQIKLEDFWRVNEDFFEVLTKTELDAVCGEIGLASAAGKTYTSLKNGSKKDFVSAMLKVEGFKYEGAVPKLMRWSAST